jgi:hypothetical protein
MSYELIPTTHIVVHGTAYCLGTAYLGVTNSCVVALCSVDSSGVGTSVLVLSSITDFTTLGDGKMWFNSLIPKIIAFFANLLNPAPAQPTEKIVDYTTLRQFLTANAKMTFDGTSVTLTQL